MLLDIYFLNDIFLIQNINENKICLNLNLTIKIHEKEALVKLINIVKDNNSDLPNIQTELAVTSS